VVKSLLILLVCSCAAAAFLYAQDTQKTGAIYGRVLNAAQEVVEDAKIEVVSGPSGIGTTVKSRGRDSVSFDGGFFIPRLSPGKYSVTVSHEKYIDQEYEDLMVEAGRGTRIIAELQPMEDIAGSISGSVVIRGVSVKGLVVGCIKDEEKKPFTEVTLEKDGRFSFDNLMPGEYRLVVTKEREEVHKTDLLTVSKKRNTRHTIRLKPEALLEKPGWISGRVLGPDHRPVKGASITLTKMPDGQKKVSARSNDEGKFELKGLRPGSYELMASRSGVGEDTARAYVRSDRGKTVTFYLKPK
jgi:hypothetical protein